MTVIIYDEALDVWKPGAHAGTFRGNQLAMAAGSATIRVMRGERLHLHAEAMGSRLRGHLVELQRRFACIGDVRGRGLMVGMELVDPTAPCVAGAYPTHGKLAAALQLACIRRGLIVELGGRNGSTMRFLPPLIITEAEIDHVAEIVGSALAATAPELVR
jgi:diaminobutyrate-2-oxoglutarate transaminase